MSKEAVLKQLTRAHEALKLASMNTDDEDLRDIIYDAEESLDRVFRRVKEHRNRIIRANMGEQEN